MPRLFTLLDMGVGLKRTLACLIMIDDGLWIGLAQFDPGLFQHLLWRIERLVNVLGIER